MARAPDLRADVASGFLQAYRIRCAPVTGGASVTSRLYLGVGMIATAVAVRLKTRHVLYYPLERATCAEEESAAARDKRALRMMDLHVVRLLRVCSPKPSQAARGFSPPARHGQGCISGGFPRGRFAPPLAEPRLDLTSARLQLTSRLIRDHRIESPPGCFHLRAVPCACIPPTNPFTTTPLFFLFSTDILVFFSQQFSTPHPPT